MTTHSLLRVFVLTAAAALSACTSNTASHAPNPPASEQSGVKSSTGVLHSGYAAIGGESTGWMLESPDLERPIEADVSQVNDVARQWERKPVRVWGRIVTKKYVERGEVSMFVGEGIDPVM